MDKALEPRLRRGLLNAEPFLWGTVPGKKEKVITALIEQYHVLPAGTSLRSSYEPLLARMLVNPGLDRILMGVVAAAVQARFADRPGALDTLREYWMRGEKPSWKAVAALFPKKKLGRRFLDSFSGSHDDTNDPQDLNWRKDHADILDCFLEVNRHYGYIHTWTTFAMIWFEDIEPLLKGAERGR